MSLSPRFDVQLARQIYKRTHLVGSFRLRSGVVSGEYFDKYLFESDPALLKAVAEQLVDLLPDGVEALAGCLAEGGELADRRLAVIEDVVTSGGQLIASCEALRKRGAEIADVICVIDRETGGAANLAEHGLQLRAVWTMSQLRHAAVA